MPHKNSNLKDAQYQNPPYLLWVDLEMTGLDSSRDSILEVAAIVTDWDFKILDQYEAIIHQPESVIDNMNDWCKNQFKLNGLTEKVRSSNLSLSQAESELIEMLNKYFNQNQPIILAGNSVHADRAFIIRYMPKLEQRLHYRMLDVSSFKVVFQNKYHKLFKKGESHRALDDIKESIAELKFYLRGFND